MKLILIVFIQILIPRHLEGATKILSLNERSKISKKECKKKLIEFYKMNPSPEKNYFEGVCHLRLKNFKIALEKLRLLKKMKYEYEGFYYDYGQALYTNNNLEEAKKAFSKSIEKEYKKYTSLYYVAHIDDILGNLTGARKNFLKIALAKKSSKTLKQVARYQIAEIFLKYAEKKYNNDKKTLKKIVEQYVLKQFEKSKKIIPRSAIIPEINLRMRSAG